jgi:hypothetical protein
VKLDLENKGLGHEGCQALGSLLGHHPALCELALGRNALQDACVEALLHDVGGNARRTARGSNPDMLPIEFDSSFIFDKKSGYRQERALVN